MCKALSSRQTIKCKGLEDVTHGCGVGAGARQGVVIGQCIKYACLVEKVIPRYESTVGCEFFVAAVKVEFTSRWAKLKMKRLFTHWVNLKSVFFSFQMPSPYRIQRYLTILNFGF